MCLYPNKTFDKHTSPRNKYGYKIVTSQLKSCTYPTPGITWKPGRVVRANVRKAISTYKWHRSFGEGIHVYTTLSRALSSYGYMNNTFKLVRVRLDPADWLGSCTLEQRAVYKKVVVDKILEVKDLA